MENFRLTYQYAIEYAKRHSDAKLFEPEGEYTVSVEQAERHQQSGPYACFVEIELDAEKALLDLYDLIIDGTICNNAPRNPYTYPEIKVAREILKL